MFVNKFAEEELSKRESTEWNVDKKSIKNTRLKTNSKKEIIVHMRRCGKGKHKNIFNKWWLIRRSTNTVRANWLDILGSKMTVFLRNVSAC